MKQEPRFPNKLLVSGMLLILGGIVFLVWSLGLFPGVIPWLVSLWPVPLIGAGLVMLYLVYLKGKSGPLLLPGMILILGGVFFILYNTVIPEKSLARIWPAFMAIAGLAMLPYAFKLKKRARAGMFISAATLIALSVMFFPFSLKLIAVDFLHFAIRWWPAIIILTGLILILSFAVNNRRRKKTPAPKNEPPARD